MRRLVWFELKKIFSRKLVWVGMLLVLAVSMGGFSDMSPGSVAYEQEIAARYEGILNDEKVQRMLADFKPTQEQIEQWKGIDVAYIGMNSMQQAVHRLFANSDGSWNGKTVRDVYGDQKIQVGYYSGWLDFSQNLVKVTVALAILSIIMVAPVFSGEYGGADSLLLTARFGRTKCVTAKLLAAFLACLCLLLIFLAGNFIAAGILMGREGLDSSVLFCGIYYENYMRFPIDCGTMLWYQAVLAVTGIIMLVGITVLLSALASSQTVALIAAAALFLCPQFFSIPETSPVFRIIGLFPVYHFQFSSLMSVEQIDGNLLYAVWAIPAAALTAVLGMGLAGWAWRRHEVN